MPCLVLVEDNIAVPVETNDGSPNTKSPSNQSVPESPPTKRRKANTPSEEPPDATIATNEEGSITGIAAKDHSDLDEACASNVSECADDTIMDYDDPMDVTEDTVAIVENEVDEAIRSVIGASTASGLNSESSGKKKKTLADEEFPVDRWRRRDRIVSKECPVCQKIVPDYIRHMCANHYVRPNNILLNHFWCKGCKMPYQPPDPNTPSGQYLPQHRETFLQFVTTHSERRCRVPKEMAPQPCRFCGYVSHHKRRPTLQCFEHEAMVHPENFGPDYPLALEMSCLTRDARHRKYERMKQTKTNSETTQTKQAVSEASTLPEVTGPQEPLVSRAVRKTCPICKIVCEDFRNHMMRHRIRTHAVFLDYFCCRECKLAYQPPDPDTPTGKYLPKDHEFFLQFIETHKKCQHSKTWPPHTCRYCQRSIVSEGPTAINCMDHEIRMHSDKVGEFCKLLRDSKTRLYAAFKTNPGNCPVCKIQVSCYGLHMISEHNILPHWIYTNYFVCRHCKMPYRSPDTRQPIGRYRSEDHESFLEFVRNHAGCYKKGQLPELGCQFCDESLTTGPDPFYLIMHQIKKHGEIIDEDSNRPIPKPILWGPPNALLPTPSGCTSASCFMHFSIDSLP